MLAGKRLIVVNDYYFGVNDKIIKHTEPWVAPMAMHIEAFQA
jgi:hypothetical protein